jgi:hypothetical protein
MIEACQFKKRTSRKNPVWVLTQTLVVKFLMGGHMSEYSSLANPSSRSVFLRKNALDIASPQNPQHYVL